MRLIRTFTLALAVILTSSLTVSAHHVEVTPTGDTDRAAFESFVSELNAQIQSVVDTLDLYFAAPSAQEKAGALLKLENAIEVTLDHLADLIVDLPVCALEYSGLSFDFVESIGVDVATSRETGDPLTFTESNKTWKLLLAYAQILGPTLCLEAEPEPIGGLS